jgi:hypothetical protein
LAQRVGEQLLDDERVLVGGHWRIPIAFRTL